MRIGASFEIHPLVSAVIATFQDVHIDRCLGNDGGVSIASTDCYNNVFIIIDDFIGEELIEFDAVCRAIIIIIVTSFVAD